jgi:hypothetical protein
MPKDQPETHQDQESQKPVDRIENKASAAQRLATPKRNLKVVKWIGTVPAVGVCSYCCMQFKVPMTAMKSVAECMRVSGSDSPNTNASPRTPAASVRRIRWTG